MRSACEGMWLASFRPNVVIVLGVSTLIAEQVARCLKA